MAMSLPRRRSLTTAEDSLIQSRTSLAVKTISLFKALGGGWGEGAPAGQ